MVILIQEIPCPLPDIKRESHVPCEPGSLVYDAGMYKSYDGTIRTIESLSSFLLKNIKLENIFFVWCETFEIVNATSSKFEIADLVIDDTNYPQNNRRNQKSTRSEKSNGNPLAIVVYKCCDAKCIKPFYRCNQNKSHKKNDRDNISGLKPENFCPISNIHDRLINCLYTSNRLKS